MAYVIVRRKTARDWWIRAMAEANDGYLPTVFLEGDRGWRIWRIQSNDLGNEALDAINRGAPNYAQLDEY